MSVEKTLDLIDKLIARGDMKMARALSRKIEPKLNEITTNTIKELHQSIKDFRQPKQKGTT